MVSELPNALPVVMQWYPGINLQQSFPVSCSIRLLWDELSPMDGTVKKCGYEEKLPYFIRIKIEHL